MSRSNLEFCINNLLTYELTGAVIALKDKGYDLKVNSCLNACVSCKGGPICRVNGLLTGVQKIGGEIKIHHD